VGAHTELVKTKGAAVKLVRKTCKVAQRLCHIFHVALCVRERLSGIKRLHLKARAHTYSSNALQQIKLIFGLCVILSVGAYLSEHGVDTQPRPLKAQRVAFEARCARSCR